MTKNKCISLAIALGVLIACVGASAKTTPSKKRAHTSSHKRSIAHIPPKTTTKPRTMPRTMLLEGITSQPWYAVSDAEQTAPAPSFEPVRLRPSLPIAKNDDADEDKKEPQAQQEEPKEKHRFFRFKKHADEPALRVEEKPVKEKPDKAKKTKANSEAINESIDPALVSLLRDVAKQIKESKIENVEDPRQKRALELAGQILSQGLATAKAASDRIIVEEQKERLQKSMTAEAWDSGSVDLESGLYGSVSALWVKKIDGFVNVTIAGNGRSAKGGTKVGEFVVVITASSTMSRGFDIQTQSDVDFWLAKVTKCVVEANSAEVASSKKPSALPLKSVITERKRQHAGRFSDEIRARLDRESHGSMLQGRVEVADTHIDPAKPPETIAFPTDFPRVDQITKIVSSDSIITIDGDNFDPVVDRNRVIVDGVYDAKVLAATPTQLKAELPPNLLTGIHSITVSNNAGLRSNPGQCEVVTVQVEPFGKASGKDDLKKLMVKVVGTQNKVRLKLQNHSPEVVRLQKGDEVTVVTSGGMNNFVTLNAERLSQGNLNIMANIESAEAN